MAGCRVRSRRRGRQAPPPARGAAEELHQLHGRDGQREAAAEHKRPRVEASAVIGRAALPARAASMQVSLVGATLEVVSQGGADARAGHCYHLG